MKTFEAYLQANYPEYIRTPGTKFYNWNKFLYDMCSETTFEHLADYSIKKMLAKQISILDTDANYSAFCNLYADLYGIPQTVLVYELGINDALTSQLVNVNLSPHHRLRLTAFKLMSAYTDGSAGSINAILKTVFSTASIKISMKTDHANYATAKLLLVVDVANEFDDTDKILYYNKLYNINLLGIKVDVQAVGSSDAMVYDFNQVYDSDNTPADTTDDVYYDGGSAI